MFDVNGGKMNMRLLAALVLVLLTATVAPAAEKDPAFLLQAMTHPDQRIREQARDQLFDIADRAAPVLTRAVAHAPAATAGPAGCMLINFEDKDLDGVGPALLKIVQQQANGNDPLRFYIASFTLARVAPELLPQAIDAYLAALHSNSSIKQFAAVQALFDMPNRATARRATGALAALAHRRGLHFRGLRMNVAMYSPSWSGEIERQAGFTTEIGAFTLPLRLVEQQRKAAAAKAAAIASITGRKPTAVQIQQGSNRFLNLRSAYIIEPLFILATLIKIKAPASSIEPQLVMLLQSEKSEVRRQAAELLIELKPHNTQPLVAGLLSLLRYTHPDVKLWAMNQLGELGPQAAAAISQLNLELNDADPFVREAAATSLADIAGRNPHVAIKVATALRFHDLSGGDVRVMKKALAVLQGKTPSKPNGPARQPERVQAEQIELAPTPASPLPAAPKAPAPKASPPKAAAPPAAPSQAATPMAKTADTPQQPRSTIKPGRPPAIE